MIEQKLSPLKQALSHHKAYGLLNSTDNIRTFMEYHVYAVWDFMTLLKALQRRLTCVDIRGGNQVTPQKLCDSLMKL